MNELKLCPFCNGEASFSTGQIGISRAIAHYVECLECAASSDMKFSMMETKEAWNKRANEWISVSERFPKEYEDVLAIGEDEIVIAKYYGEDNGGWATSMNKTTDHITHWMPLPELTKDE